MNRKKKITSLEIDVENMQKEVTSLKEENSSLRIAVDDLENRSRRQNLVFHGIPEGGEGENCRRTVVTILQEFVGLSPSAYKMERVHRTPTTMQQRSQARDPQHSQRGNTKNVKPRMIHVCFSIFSQKERVKAECVKKFKAEEYDGHKLYVAEDLSKRVRNQRRARIKEFKRLRLEGKKPFFIYPAKLAHRDLKTGKLVFV